MASARDAFGRRFPAGRRGARIPSASFDAGRPIIFSYSSARALGCAVIPQPAPHIEAHSQHDRGLPPVSLQRHPDSLPNPARRGGTPGDPSRRSIAPWCRAPRFPKSADRQIRSRGVDACPSLSARRSRPIAYETPPSGHGGQRRPDLRDRAPGTGIRCPKATSAKSSSPPNRSDPHHPWDSPRARELTPRARHGPCGRTTCASRVAWPRRPDHQGEGHVRAARTGRGDRQASSRTGTLRLVVTRTGNRRDDAQGRGAASTPN